MGSIGGCLEVIDGFGSVVKDRGVLAGALQHRNKEVVGGVIGINENCETDSSIDTGFGSNCLPGLPRRRQSCVGVASISHVDKVAPHPKLAG